MTDRILLAHGSGGELTHRLIEELFLQYFGNPTLNELYDSALLKINGQRLAFTTDSYVVRPLFFPGGDIGRLAVCGTVNDLAVSGATPLFVSAGFIIEEGLEYETLKKVVASMSEAAKEAGVLVVTGDTKVVEKGSADKLFINTSGIGVADERFHLGYKKISPGDKVIINGTIGDHGIAVMTARGDFGITLEVKSDSAPLNQLISLIADDPNVASGVRFMRDPTRGGVATTLVEVAEKGLLDIVIHESSLPILEEVKSASEMLGIDPLYSANEGKVLIIASKDAAENIVSLLRTHPLGREAMVIGEVKEGRGGGVFLNTTFGTRRRISMLTGNMLPRIC